MKFQFERKPSSRRRLITPRYLLIVPDHGLSGYGCDLNPAAIHVDHDGYLGIEARHLLDGDELRRLAVFKVVDLAGHDAVFSEFDAVSHTGDMAGLKVETKGDRPHARSEITIRPITTSARETPEEVVRSPYVERGSL